jgi:hypothetical protein
VTLRCFEVRVPVLVREVTCHVQHSPVPVSDPRIGVVPRPMLVRVTVGSDQGEEDAVRLLGEAIEQVCKTMDLWV